MSAIDIDRTLADWFQSDALGTEPADGVALALAGARRHRPRPAWLAGPGSHWGWAPPRVGSPVPVRALVAIALLTVLLGGAIVVGVRLLVPPTPLPADLGQLAYAVDGDIFLADWDGANPTRIADGLPGGKLGCGLAGYWAEGPMWSPDGQFLAYRSPRSQVDCDRPDADTYPTVLLSDATGHVVAEVPGVGWSIPWSPDSTRFATWLDLYPSTRIGVYGIDGVRQTVLSMPPPSDGTMNGDYDPVWSPDGESLLSKSGAGIVEIPVDGRAPRPLPADDPRSRWRSSRSPDRASVAYVAGRPIPGQGALVVAAADGSQPRELFSDVTESWGYYPAWSPTGDRIAFVAGGINEERYDAVTQVFWDHLDARLMDLRVIDVASGAWTTVIPAGSGDGMSVIEFSPEGDRILFSRWDDDGEAQSLWSVDADGSDLQLLVDRTIQGDWQSLMGTSGPRATPSP